MYNTEEQLANLCDMRKAIISGLSLMGLTAQQIYNCLSLPYTEDVGQHITDALQHYDTVAKFMRQCEDLGVAPDSDAVVYYFDYQSGVHEVWVIDLMSYDKEYEGQKLVASRDEIIPKILRPLMDEAIEAGSAERIDQLAKAMVYVLTKLQPKESDNVN